MKITLFILFQILLSCASNSRPTICEYLELDNCNNSKRSLSRSSGASLPSVNSAAFSNPAAIALNRGVGIESIHYHGQAQLGIVTGTGRIGAALSNNPTDGTFFGNVPIESVNDFRKRSIDFLPYTTDKISLATAVNIVGGKSKKGMQLDLGIIYKRQTLQDQDYYGAGIILSFNKLFSLGYSEYSDVYYQKLSGTTGEIFDQFGNATTVIYPDDYSLDLNVKYSVKNTILGMKFSNIALDFISITTESKEDVTFDDTLVKIFNLSYFYQKWIFTYGSRYEKSFREVFDNDIKEYVTQEEKQDGFLGAQYATKNGFVLGAFLNYYLYNELSLGVTYFF